MKSYLVAAFVAGTVLTAAHAGAQDADITTARDLYASAAYDDALMMLNRLRSAEHPASQSRVECWMNVEYRVVKARIRSGFPDSPVVLHRLLDESIESARGKTTPGA